MPNELIPYANGVKLDELQNGGAVTTYDAATIDGQIATLRAMQRAERQLQDRVGEEVVIEHIVAHWVDHVDETTGEVTGSVRYVLISPDGTRTSTRSAPAMSDVRRARECLGRELPFNPPLRFLVSKPKALVSKRDYLCLTLLGEYHASTANQADAPTADSNSGATGIRPTESGAESGGAGKKKRPDVQRH